MYSGRKRVRVRAERLRRARARGVGDLLGRIRGLWEGVHVRVRDREGRLLAPDVLTVGGGLVEQRPS
jgi:hypothetical protein